MKLTQRNVILGMFLFITIVTGISLVNAIFTYGLRTTITLWTSIGLLGDIILLFVYWRGWEPARYIYLMFVTLVIAFALDPAESHWFFTTMVPVAAAIMAGPLGILGSSVCLYVILLIRGGGQGPFTDLGLVLFFSMVVGTITLGRLVTLTAQRSAEASAREAEEAKVRAEAHAERLVEASQRQTEQLEQQQQLLDLVALLETPAIQLAEGVLFAPLVGQLDSRRAQALTTRLLEAAYSQRAKLVILDITGVTVVDTMVAKALLDTAQALRLLGCQVAISGISSQIAITLSRQGIAFRDVSIVRNPQEALARYHELAL